MFLYNNNIWDWFKIRFGRALILNRCREKRSFARLYLKNYKKPISKQPILESAQIVERI
jgi:hypothetical protein